MPLEMVPLPCLGGKISLRASRLLMQRPSFILLDLEAKVEEKALRLKTLSFFKKKNAIQLIVLFIPAQQTEMYRKNCLFFKKKINIK